MRLEVTKAQFTACLTQVFLEKWFIWKIQNTHKIHARNVECSKIWWAWYHYKLWIWTGSEEVNNQSQKQKFGCIIRESVK